jgi:hypothetical protein
MTAKHTPGPWTVVGFPDRHTVSDKHDGPVCLVYPRRSEQQNEATAHLIAAAPDMLVTLEKCIAALEAMDRCYATRLNEEDGEVLLEACAVVAKAKGETP